MNSDSSAGCKDAGQGLRNFSVLCEYIDNPVGIERPPRLNWSYDGKPQTAFRIQVWITEDAVLFDSGTVESGTGSFELSGLELRSATIYHYTVAVRTTDGTWTKSPECRFETALLRTSDFTGQWITTPDCEAPVIRHTFTVKQAESARLYIAGLGYSEIYINSRRVSDRVLDPAWSDYEKRELTDLLYPIHDTFSHTTYYVIHDITGYIREGENAIAVCLGNGWYNQHERTCEGKLNYGLPKLFCKLCADGKDVLVSDGSWKWTSGPITFNNIYYGEKYDARLEPGDVSAPGYDDGSWQAVTLAAPTETVMRAQLCPPDRVADRVIPRLVRQQQDKRIYDMGRNSSGWVKIRTSAPAGSVIEIRHAEELNEDFSLNYGTAGGKEQIQTDVYISDGKPGRIYHPHFTFHGFRYFEITGQADVECCEIVHSDIRQTGSFECSDETLNWIVKAYINSQLSNLHSGVPSDCPHRERLGYTGDGQNTASTALLYLDMPAFYIKWMRDIADCQCKVSGHVQHTAPFYGGGGGPGGWGCAMVLVPYQMYRYCGDIRILNDYYHNMCEWMRYLGSRSCDNVIVKEEEGGWCLGDWCFDGKCAISEPFVNTCYYAKCAEVMTKAAELTGHSDEARRYEKLSGQIKKSIVKHFYHKDTACFDSGKQGANAFAAELGLCGSRELEALKDYYEKRGHFDTGIFGTSILLDVLADMGEAQLAYKLLTTEGYPSFSEWREQGATTLRECWGSGGSHNHPMFGSVAGFLLRRFAGICPDESAPALEPVIIAPEFVSELNYVKASVKTLRGEIAVHWFRKGEKIQVEIRIPSNTEALFIHKCHKTELHSGLNTIEI